MKTVSKLIIRWVLLTEFAWRVLCLQLAEVATCLRVNGFQTWGILCIQILAVQQSLTEETVFFMGGRTKIFCTGDGNQNNVNFLVSVRKHFSVLFKGRQWLSSVTLLPGIKWIPYFASCRRLVRHHLLYLESRIKLDADMTLLWTVSDGAYLIKQE